MRPSDLRVPPGLEARADELCAALDGAPRALEVDDMAFTLDRPEHLAHAQAGYSVDPEGYDITGDGVGDWRPSWIVIGYDGLDRRPLFVDLAEEGLPVFTAEHGQGDWDPEELAPTLDALLGG